MPLSDDFVTAMAHDIRSAVAAASGRLQFTVRRIERGNVDLGRLIEDLHDLDVHVMRICDLVAAIEAITPLAVATDGAADV